MNSLYDQMDIVNHLLKQIQTFGYKGKELHFLMCDECQDLTPATQYLLMKNVKQDVIMLGDTAQTITQGVGFRFWTLEKVFEEFDQYKKPTIKQLTVNFWSHN